MLFSETPLQGAYLIELKPFHDERGFFAVGFSQEEFLARGLAIEWVQSNIVNNKKRGTTRGMHFQKAPFEEDKLIRCTRGTIFDVMVDLRPDSPTYLSWFGTELTEENRKMVYVPKGFAHGYQTLTDNTDVFYQVSQVYAPHASGGLMWNDPQLAIAWPENNPANAFLSERDTQWPLLLTEASVLS